MIFATCRRWLRYQRTLELGALLFRADWGVEATVNEQPCWGVDVREPSHCAK